MILTVVFLSACVHIFIYITWYKNQEKRMFIETVFFFFFKLRHNKIAYKVNLILLQLAFWPGNQALCIASSLIIRLSFCLQRAI